MIFVGIDVAKDKHDCFILNSEGTVLADVFTIANNRIGFETLLSRIQSCSQGESKIKVGLEATGHYSYNLLGFLLDSGLATYVINPLHTNLYRKSLSLRRTKTDRIDARTIAMMLMSDPAALEYAAIPPCCCPAPGSVFPSFPPGNWKARRSAQREPSRQWQSLGSCFRPACGCKCLTDGRSSHGTWGPPGISAFPLWRRPCPPLPGIPPLRSLPCSRKSCSFLLPGGRRLH